MNCASDKFFSVHSTGGPDIFGGCVRALDLLRGRRAARFHFAAAEAGSKKHCSEFKRSSISGQFRDRRAGENLCLSRQSRRTVEGGWVVAESRRDSQDFTALSSFPGISDRTGGLAEFSGIQPQTDHLNS